MATSSAGTEVMEAHFFFSFFFAVAAHAVKVRPKHMTHTAVFLGLLFECFSEETRDATGVETGV